MAERREPTTDKEYDVEAEAYSTAGERASAEDPPVDEAGTPSTAPLDRHPTERLGSTVPPMRMRLDAWRDRYDDHGELARGGMSSIRTMRDNVMQREVAMKVLDPGKDPVGMAHFAQEARITGQLDHPNIVPVYDLQQDGDLLPTRFTMKLIEGETFADTLEREARVRLHSDTLERLLQIFLKVCDAVSFAHSRGVIHCDIKPSNIMVGSHGQAYLMDWGVAVERGVPSRQVPGEPRPVGGSGSMSGTPAYMAPEQAWGRAEEIDPRTDVYGLGGILYALLTLVPPHNGIKPAHDLELARSGQVPPPREVITSEPLPPGLCRIAMRALYPEQEGRYQTVEALKADVERFVRGGGWFEAVHYDEGALIVREGDVPDAAFIITEGHCELFREADGKRKVMGTMGEGEVFGETSIFGDTARTASVEATTDVTVMRVTRAALTRELERTEWLRAFVETLAQRFIELEHRIRALEDEGKAER